MQELTFTLVSSDLNALVEALKEARRWYRFMIDANKKFHDYESLSYGKHQKELEDVIAKLEVLLEQDAEIHQLDAMICKTLSLEYFYAQHAAQTMIDARIKTAREMATPAFSVPAQGLFLGMPVVVLVPYYRHDPNGRWLRNVSEAISEEVEIRNTLERVIGELPQWVSEHITVDPGQMNPPMLLAGVDPSWPYYAMAGNQMRVGAAGKSEVVCGLNMIEQGIFFRNDTSICLNESLFERVNSLKDWFNAIEESPINPPKPAWYQQSAVAVVSAGLRKFAKAHGLSSWPAEKIAAWMVTAAPPPGARVWENRAPRFLSKLKAPTLTARRFKAYRPPRFHTGFGAKSNRKK